MVDTPIADATERKVTGSRRDSRAAAWSISARRISGDGDLGTGQERSIEMLCYGFLTR